MVRPVYESQQDRDNEAAIIARVCKRWRCNSSKLPISHIIDYALTRDGKVIAAAEVKCRTNPMKQYPTLIVSLDKVMAAQKFQQIGIKTFLIYSWTDCTGYLPLIGPDRFAMGGRKDRGDPGDLGIVAHFRTDRAVILETLSTKNG